MRVLRAVRRVKPSLARPALARVPRGVARRLVDTGELAAGASAAGASERYRRGETSHTVHVWWARRPHAAMRPLVFASLARGASARGRRLLGELSVSGRPSRATLREASRLLALDGGPPPRLLDMFGGGGTIALEASALGVEACSVDSNQLAVFIQKCHLEYPRSVAPRALVRLVKDAGRRALNDLARASAGLFPGRGGVFGFYWTYSRTCRACGGAFFLSKRPWLSRRNGRRIAVRSRFTANGERSIEVGEVDGSWRFDPAWRGRHGTVACPHCGKTCSEVRIGDTRDELVATARRAEPRGKTFEPAGGGLHPPPDVVAAIEERTLAELGARLPATPLPRWSGIVNPALYGVTTHADFLNPRQRAVVLLLIRSIRREHERLARAHGAETARSVAAYLSGLVDQLLDWNSRLSMWIPENEQVGRAFCGPGVAMLWDYMETDPVLDGPANLWRKLERIARGIAPAGKTGSVRVEHARAQELPFEDESFDAIVTDPPYYDNVHYGLLADFFYAWKRLLLREIDPGLFQDESTGGAHELVASKLRDGSSERAHEGYCRELARALSEAERVLKRDGVFSLVYSHGSLRGWEALARAYRATGLRITSVEPLRIERRARPRAMASGAVNTCMVFVARKCAAPRRMARLDRLARRVRGIGADLERRLRAAGWHDVEIGAACFAHGVGLLANAKGLSGGLSDRAALKSLEAVVQETFPAFRLAGRTCI